MSEAEPIVPGPFGRLTVVRVVPPGVRLEVACACGNTRTYRRALLERGDLTSCGCGRTTPTTAFGTTRSLKEWSLDERCLVKYATLVRRIVRGWDPEAAIGTPVVPKWDSNKRRKYRGTKRP